MSLLIIAQLLLLRAVDSFKVSVATMRDGDEDCSGV